MYPCMGIVFSLYIFFLLQSFGGLTGVEVDPNNSNNLIFTFRTRTDAEKVQVHFVLVILM